MASESDRMPSAAYTLSGVVEFGQEANRPGDATNAPGHDTEGDASMPDKVIRGPRYESRRFFHERTGEPMSAYVVGEYVIEKARRDWDARPYRGSAGNPTKREWWEVRRQGSHAHPGCSVGRNPLFAGDTLMECMAWIRCAVVSGQDRTAASVQCAKCGATKNLGVQCAHPECPYRSAATTAPQNGMTAAGCTCSAYYEGQRVVVDRTRCPIHSPLRDLSPMGGGPNPWKDKAR